MGGGIGDFLSSDIGKRVQAWLPGFLQGEANKDYIRNRTNPLLDTFKGGPRPEDRTNPTGRGSQDTRVGGPQGSGFDITQYLNNSGIGRGVGQNQYMLPSMPGYQDIASASYAGALNKFGSLQDVAAGQQEGYQRARGAYDSATSGLKDTKGNVKANAQQGQKDIQALYRDSMNQIARGRAEAKFNQQQSLSRINQFVGESRRELETSVQEIRDVRADALEGHAERTAQKMNDISTGWGQKISADAAEIMGRQDIPQAVRESMVQRLKMVGGQQLLNAGVATAEKAALEYDNLLSSQNSMLSSTLSNASTAYSQVLQTGAKATTDALAVGSNAQMQLSVAAVDAAKGFVETSSTFRANMVNAEAGIQQVLSGLQMSGSIDLYNMVSSMTRPYMDLSQVMSGIVAFGLGLDDAIVNRNAIDMTAEMQSIGLEINSSMDLTLQGLNASSQLMMSQNAPKPPKSKSALGGGLAAAASIVLAPATGGASLVALPSAIGSMAP